MGGVIGQPQGPIYDSDNIRPSPQTPPPPPPKPPETHLNFGPGGAVHPYQYLSTAFIFDARGRLKIFMVRDRPYAPIPKGQKDFAETRRLHPDMSDEELIAAYKQSGAKFALGDREAFKRALPIRKLEKFLGSLRIVSIEFEPTGDERLDRLGDFGFCISLGDLRANSIRGLF